MFLFGILVAVFVLFSAQDASMQRTYSDDGTSNEESTLVAKCCPEAKRALDALSNEIARLSKIIEAGNPPPITGTDTVMGVTRYAWYEMVDKSCNWSNIGFKIRVIKSTNVSCTPMPKSVKCCVSFERQFASSVVRYFSTRCQINS